MRRRGRPWILGSALCACTGSVEPALPGPSGAGAITHLPDGGVVVIPGGGNGKDDPAGNGMGSGSLTGGFQALTAPMYVGKVKGILTGLPPTADEVAAVTKDASALRTLIGTWLKTPEYQARMLDFFTMAFQQGDVTANMINAASSFEQGMIDDRVIQNMRESFGRTALQLIAEGRPFTETLTTKRFMLTPALMVAMAWLDERHSGDGGGVDDALIDALGPNQTYTLQGDTKIPIEQSVDPTNPNFFKFYSAQLAAAKDGCHDSFVVDQQDNRLTLYNLTMGETLMMYFMGNPIGHGFCRYGQMDNVLTAADFNTWRMMTIRPPKQGEKPTWVYQIPTFRTGTELVFTRPTVGFFTTPSFLYNWQTNDSNQGRVTINQTMITALGAGFDGTHFAKPVSEAAVDSAHATPGSTCYGCHVTMDPMRQYFRSTYTLYWSAQTDKKQTSMPGVWAFDGESHMGTGLDDLANSMASNPRFATAWTHKLCTWANGAVCDPSGSIDVAPSDPEFLRIANAFASDNFSWTTLVTELFSSPLVTYASETATSTARGASFAVAKRAQLCQSWDARLGLDDVCGLHALPSTSSGDAVKTIATVLPSDSYSRGQTLPTLANDPGLFFFAGVENACVTLAPRVVDPKSGTAKYASSDFTSAIADMVHELMGLPAPRDQEPISILTEHYQDALQTGASATDALRSTFVLACMSPSLVTVGQ